MTSLVGHWWMGIGKDNWPMK